MTITRTHHTATCQTFRVSLSAYHEDVITAEYDADMRWVAIERNGDLVACYECPRGWAIDISRVAKRAIREVYGLDR